MKGRFFDAVTGQFQETAQARWFATATGRIGYTITPPTLIYVKGGAAWVRNQYEDTFDFASSGAIPRLLALVATRLTVPPALPNSAGLSV